MVNGMTGGHHDGHDQQDRRNLQATIVGNGAEGRQLSACWILAMILVHKDNGGSFHLFYER